MLENVQPVDDDESCRPDQTRVVSRCSARMPGSLSPSLPPFLPSFLASAAVFPFPFPFATKIISMQISSPAKPATTEKIELKLESGFIKQNYQLERGNVEDAKILVSCLSMRIPSFRICCTTASKLISRIKTKMTHRIRLSELGRRAVKRSSVKWKN